MKKLETFSDRLRHFREQHLKVAAYNMATNILNIDPSQYKRVEAGTGNLNYTYLAFLATEYGLNLNWLIAGTGNMLLTDDTENPVISLVKEFLSEQIGNNPRVSAKQLTEAGRILKGLEAHYKLEERANKLKREELEKEMREAVEMTPKILRKN